MLEAASRFNTIDYDNIIFTKLDEATGLGSMYDVINEVGKPVSYLTVGQNVPNDIEDANPGKNCATNNAPVLDQGGIRWIRLSSQNDEGNG